MVRSGKDTVLLDCGEGTQRQIMVSPFSFMKIGAVFITHLHGDHFYGLAPLIQTMGLMGRTEPLVLRGPEGFSDALEKTLALCPGEIGYELDVADMPAGGSLVHGSLTITSFATEHGIPSEGFIIREADTRGKVDAAKAKSLGVGSDQDMAQILSGKTVNGVTAADICGKTVKGLSVAYTGDTGKCPTIAADVKGCDLLIHESTYTESQRELADTHFHSTARYAAQNAMEAGCRHLVLTHFSNRYKDRSVLLKEASEVFPDTVLASDLAQFKLTRQGLRAV